MKHKFWSRRDFLKLALMISASTVLAQCRRTSGNRTEKIVVIGAGMAGISAARTLHDAGFSVIVLEGRNRIGGRVWTSREWPDTPLDMGASWIHGVNRNPLTIIADAIDAPRLKTNHDNAALFDNSGALVGNSGWSRVDSFQSLMEKAIRQAQSKAEDVSLEAAMDDVIDIDSLSPSRRRALDLFFSAYIEGEWAADVAELSAKQLLEGDEFDGDDVLFPQGYGALVEHLAANLDIRLGNRVECIEYSDIQVTITTSEGAFQAERAIVTLPLGILKQGDIEFSPALSVEKVEAINTLGFGVLNKLYLRFPDAFWQKRAEWINYLADNKGEWSAWLNIYHYVDQPILAAFSAGHFGEIVETLSDEGAVAAAMAVLRTMYGEDIPNPEAFQMTRWIADPFARGSYSFPAVGITNSTRRALAEPVNNRLFFAGEATHSVYPATVHGAYLSGQREAERIQRLASGS